MESYIEDTVVTLAENAGYFVRKVGWIGRKSAPDRVFIKGGRTVWIEFKDTNEEPTLLQVTEHRKMRAAGAEVYACDNIRDARRILGV